MVGFVLYHSARLGRQAIDALMDEALPITRVHDRTVELETLFKKAFPAIHKVTIHTEPESERGVSGRPLRSVTSRSQ